MQAKQQTYTLHLSFLQKQKQKQQQKTPLHLYFCSVYLYHTCTFFSFSEVFMPAHKSKKKISITQGTDVFP